ISFLLLLIAFLSLPLAEAQVGGDLRGPGGLAGKAGFVPPGLRGKDRGQGQDHGQDKGKGKGHSHSHSHSKQNKDD
ncbi:hypothetical protein PMAYCL1PPCAC_15782, partial [Pristionchus mayeri]